MNWLGILGGVGEIVDDLVTTEEERRKLDLEEKKLDQNLQLAQVGTNNIEAASASTFVAGWRPYVGWVCGTALGLIYIPKALVMTAIWTYQAIVIISHWKGSGAPPILPNYPDLGVTDLIGLLLALLGMGSLRSFDKVKGVDTKRTEKRAEQD